MNVEKINHVLKILNKRIKVTKFRGYADYTHDIEFYQLNNGKMLIVCLEFGIIKSILRQMKDGRYSYNVNGRDGTNVECIYIADYNYENSKYVDILAS